MGETLIKTIQLENDVPLPVIKSPQGDRLEALLLSIDRELNTPLRLFATNPSDSKLNIAASSILKSDGTAKSIPPIFVNVPNVPASTIDFQTGATTGALFNLTLPASTVGRFRRCVFSMNISGTITGTFSAESLTVGALANPGSLFPDEQLRIGWIDLQCTHVSGKYKTAGSASSVIENSVGGTSRIVQVFGSNVATTSTGGSAGWVAREVDLDLGVDTVNVLFASPQPDESYIILPFLQNLTDASPMFPEFEVISKGVNGFSVKLSSPTDSANYTLTYIVPFKSLVVGEAAVSLAANNPVVALPVPENGGNYGLVALLQNIVDADPQFQPIVIGPKTGTNFTVRFNSPTDSANYKISYLKLATVETDIPLGATSVVVGLPIGFGSTNYAVFSVFKNEVESNPQFQPKLVTAKSGDNFTVSWSDPTDSANYKMVSYAISYSLV